MAGKVTAMTRQGDGMAGIATGMAGIAKDIAGMATDGER